MATGKGIDGGGKPPKLSYCHSWYLHKIDSRNFFKSPEIRSVITLVSSSKCNETYRLKRRIINKLKVNKFQTSKGQAKMPICPLFCIKWKLRNQTAQLVLLGVHVSWALISWKAVEWIRRKIVRIYDVLFTVNVYVSE